MRFTWPVLNLYQQSAKFKALALGTQRARANIIEDILIKNAKLHLQDITEKTIRQGRTSPNETTRNTDT